MSTTFAGVDALLDDARSRLDRIDVQQALMQVPEDFRVVMILHDVQDLRQEEVAAIVGVPVGTVKSRIAAGLGRLRSVMAVGRSESDVS